MHNIFWIRDRFIQKALMDHNVCKYDHMDTIHPRWDIRRHPLYLKKWNSLVDLMKIRLNIVGQEYVPGVLTAAAVGDPGSKSDSADSIVVHRRKPMYRNERYNCIRSITAALEEFGKADHDAYNSIMAPLEQLKAVCET